MPALPQSGVTGEQLVLLAAVKQNIEQLIGISGTPAYRAALRGDVRVDPIGALSVSQTGVTGQAYVISGAGAVPTAEDFVRLANATQQVINDMARLRDTLDTLITQLKG